MTVVDGIEVAVDVGVETIGSTCLVPFESTVVDIVLLVVDCVVALLALLVTEEDPKLGFAQALESSATEPRSTTPVPHG